MPTFDFLQRAGRWFLDSGIQDPRGGVARYYRADLGRNALVSTEITGYAASTLLHLHARTGEAAYREAALRAGRFLARDGFDACARTFPFEFAVNGAAPEPRAYFFDLGIVARALAALWRASGDAEFLAAARAAAESMERDFASGAEFHPVLALPSKEPLPRDARWSRAPGCYQLKAALAWAELGRETRYEALLERALATHAAFLQAEPAPERVMDRLHAYCYFLEGLLPRAARPECAAALRGGIARVSALLEEIRPRFERSDVCAQLLRLRLHAAALGVAPLEEDAARQEAARIASFQLDDSDARLRGGVLFGRTAAGPLPHVNPVSAAFCLQALDAWERHRAGAFDPDWRNLI